MQLCLFKQYCYLFDTEKINLAGINETSLNHSHEKDEGLDGFLLPEHHPSLSCVGEVVHGGDRG